MTTPEELDAMDTEQMFDHLRLHTDHTLALLIDRLEERWLLTSSAAKLWFAAAAGEVKAERSSYWSKQKAEQRRLDRKAVESEHRA